MKGTVATFRKQREMNKAEELKQKIAAGLYLSLPKEVADDVLDKMQQYADEQIDKLDDYKKALEIIAHPINYLQSEAKKDGGILDSYAASQLANDSNWLRGIAINALESNQEGE